MRIAIIVFIGIFAYLIVFIPGYFFIVPDETKKLSDNKADNKTLVQLQADSSAEKSSEQPIGNPGDAPPPK